MGLYHLYSWPNGPARHGTARHAAGTARERHGPLGTLANRAVPGRSTGGKFIRGTARWHEYGPTGRLWHGALGMNTAHLALLRPKI